MRPDSELILVTGIARPERVARTARRAGLSLADHLAFPDHHRYPAASLERIERRIEELGAAGVLTTTKDHVKLRGKLDLPVAVLPVEARPEPRFWTWLEDRIDRAERER